MAFEASCHCGKVACSIDADVPTQAYECNCSHCRRKGFLLAFFPREQFTLLRGEEVLKSYFFFKHAIEHRFCSECGTQPFALGKMPDGSAMAGINMRCVESVDIASLDRQTVDGAKY
ncbi:MAG: GFA family protein [Sphingomonadales bacterium]|nr:MAG: GFA family protein [Sphingomonadales bacterium]